MREDKISLVGLGKLGLCLAACFAEAGIMVSGYDINPDVVEKVNAGVSPLSEPYLAEAIARTSGKTLVAGTDCSRAIDDTDITYILVNTPSDGKGDFSNAQIEAVLTVLAKALAHSEKECHLFVVSSTVMPGSIEGSFIPLVENLSGRKLHRGFEFAFCPDFVALGRVMDDFRNPDLLLIGESRTEVGRMVETLHLKMCRNSPPVKRMSLSGAELAKVALNAYITMKISFANTLANLAEKTPGADIDAITGAIGLDRRISPYYLKGGLSFGGTCFPRDTRAFRRVAERAGVPSFLMDAVELVNKYQDQHLLDATKSLLDGVSGRVAILGLAFKPGTPVIVESPGIKLAMALLDSGVTISLYDRLAGPALERLFAKNSFVRLATSASDCLDSVSVAVLALDEKEYCESLLSLTRPELRVLDCWRALTRDGAAGRFDLRYLGTGDTGSEWG